LTTGRITAAHGRFKAIRQVVPVWTPPNTSFLESTQVQIPNGILIGSAVFAQLTTECPHTLQWATPSPLKIGCHHPHPIAICYYYSAGAACTKGLQPVLKAVYRSAIVW